MQRPAAILLALALLTAGSATPARAAVVSAQPIAVATEGAEPAAARLLVRFRPEADDAARAAALARVGGVATGGLPDLGVTRVAAAAPGEPRALAALIAADPAVAWAEADARVSLNLTPNDPYYLNDPYTGLGEWGLRKIQADKAWDVVRGSPQLIVAVVDTGIDPAHPDLGAVALPGATFVSAPSAGCAPSTRDDSGHGTHVAGIIGASGNDGVGTVGVAFGVRILPVKALDCQGTGVVGDIAQAILYAVNNGARIINVSLGASSDSPTLRAAVQAATQRNVLIVAAAGNCGLGGGACDFANETSYPGAYPDVLAVAATDVDDNRAAFSTAAPYVGIAAPGRSIISTSPTYPTVLSQRARGATTLSYAVISGTSQATPFVAGTAALVLSREPNLTAAQLIARLKATADHLGSAGTNQQFGAGRVNAFAAVTAVAAPTYGALYDTSAVPRLMPKGATISVPVKLTNTSSFTWTAAGATPVRLAYHWSDPVGGTVVWDGARSPLPADVPPAQSVTVVASIAAPPGAGPYTLRLDLVRDGVSWFSGQGAPTANVPVTVNSGYAAAYALAATAASSLVLGAPLTLPVTVTNTGTRPWPAGGANPVRLSYHWLRADGTVAAWEGQRTPLTQDVAPNGTATLSLSVTPPAALGAYTLRVDLVQEGLTWFSGEGVAPLALPFTVTSGLAPTWSVTSPAAVLPGGLARIPVTVKNDGLGPWIAGGVTPVRLAPHVYDAVGATVLWDGPRTVLPSDVVPGASFTGELLVPAPLAAGGYRVRADLVQEGVTWFSAQGARTADVPLTVSADYRATIGVATTTVSSASPVAQVTVANTSSVLWTVGGAAPLALAPHWYDAQGATLVWDGPRTPLTRAQAPGETVTLSVALGAPPPGAAGLAVDLVADGLRWFGAGVARPVTIAP